MPSFVCTPRKVALVRRWIAPAAAAAAAAAPTIVQCRFAAASPCWTAPTARTESPRQLKHFVEEKNPSQASLRARFWLIVALYEGELLRPWLWPRLRPRLP